VGNTLVDASGISMRIVIPKRNLGALSRHALQGFTVTEKQQYIVVNPKVERASSKVIVFRIPQACWKFAEICAAEQVLPFKGTQFAQVICTRKGDKFSSFWTDKTCAGPIHAKVSTRRKVVSLFAECGGDYFEYWDHSMSCDGFNVLLHHRKIQDKPLAMLHKLCNRCHNQMLVGVSTT
jgi:hypothetical protein